MPSTNPTLADTKVTDAAAKPAGMGMGIGVAGGLCVDVGVAEGVVNGVGADVEDVGGREAEAVLAADEEHAVSALIPRRTANAVGARLNLALPIFFTLTAAPESEPRPVPWCRP